MKTSYTDIRKRCLKHDESSKPWYPRHVTHAISTRLIWLLQALPITPNFLTLLSLVVAFLALPFFVCMSPGFVLIGALLIELTYVLDALDGQWARFKNQKSLTGAFFDYLVNYAFQPPLLFAIAWGVAQKTGNLTYLALGFSAAFSTLWVLIIWNLRSTILLSYLTSQSKASGKTTPVQLPTKAGLGLRWFFGWLHKSLVFPWMMYGITLLSIASFVAHLCFGNSNFTASAFSFFIVYYGLIGPLVAVILTAHWILTRKLDAD